MQIAVDLPGQLSNHVDEKQVCCLTGRLLWQSTVVRIAVRMPHRKIVVQPAKLRPAMKINKAWHLAHRMPKNATTDQRIEWHLEHVKNCNCRTDIPAKVLEEMRKRKIAVPGYGST